MAGPSSSTRSEASRSGIEKILEDLNLTHTIAKFQEEKIDIDTVLSLSEQQIIRLGVTTIGDRLRLTEKVRAELEHVNEDKNQNKIRATLSSEILNQRNILFSSSRGRGKKRRGSSFENDSAYSASARTNKRQSKRTWTTTVVCLADKTTTKLPSAEEKEVLFRAGLGTKRVQFEVDDTDNDVIKKLSSDELKDGQTIGFPQLQSCGGFELLKCKQNCRELTLITCKWDVMTLKSCLGTQSKIYLRPIQSNLDTTPVNKNPAEETSVAKFPCKHCQCMFSVHDLRKHVHTCIGENSGSDTGSDELPDPDINMISELNVPNLPIVTQHAEEPLPVITRNQSSLQPQQHQTDVMEIVSNEDLGGAQSAGTTFSSITDYPNVHVSVSSDVTNEENKPEENETPSEIKAIIESAITYCLSQDIQNPVEILRYLQSVVVTGRKLEIEDTTQCVEGETNFILVNRHDLIESAFDEIDSISDIRKTLEVQFYDETAEDLGGPRKEFFQQILSDIKTKYFDKGLREYLAKDYYTVGKIMSLSILQNGKLPRFMEPEILDGLFSSTESESQCITNLKRGLDSLGLIQVGKALPTFVYLLRPSQTALTLKYIVQTLKPKFSEEGSNNRRFEDSVYTAYLKYLRAVASGRREFISLQNVLQFATGSTEEPVLGFTLHPSIEFVEVKQGSSFLPTANTCINTMQLPRPSLLIDLPPTEELFKLYDYAFLNTYFGLY